MSMQPIPATAEAVGEHGPFSYRGCELLLMLSALAEQVEHEVPACVGLTLSLAESGATFALIASGTDVAALDTAAQVDGEPVGDRRPRTTVGVRSTLSLPVVTEGEARGGFILYASTDDAFEGRHEEVARILGVSSGGAVGDVDLTLAGLEEARRAPEVLRVQTRLVVAAHLLGAGGRLSPAEAEERVRAAAMRTGVPLGTVVDLVIELLGLG